MSYGGFRRNDNFGPKPVETGKEYDVQITEISRKGDGIARIQGFVIFVKNGKVGQNAKIRVLQVGNRFATAEIVNGEGSPSSSPSSTSTISESSNEQLTSYAALLPRMQTAFRLYFYFTMLSIHAKFSTRIISGFILDRGTSTVFF